MTYCRMSCLLMDWKRLTLIALQMPSKSSHYCKKYVQSTKALQNG